MKKIFYSCIVLFLISLTTFSQIPSYLPSNGLLGWWPFNGNANDESGNGNNGTNNGATLTSDRFGNVSSAYNFNGVSNVISIPNSATLNFTGSPITISFWVYLPQYQSIDKSNNCIYKASYASGPSGIRCWFQGASFYTFYIGNGSYSTAKSVVGDQSTDIGINKWTHIVFTFDNTILKCYVNGQLLHQNTISDGTTIGSSNSPLYFGGPNIPNSSSDNYFAGILDDIGIWNRALTQQEITDIDVSSNNVGINTLTPLRNLHINNTLRLEPRSSAPSNPSKGDIYFDGILNKLRVYDGTTWQNCW